MQDYPSREDRAIAESNLESIAESRAPPEMLAAQREWDNESAKVAEPNYGEEEPVGTFTPE